jgi:hypothetical protein
MGSITGHPEWNQDLRNMRVLYQDIHGFSFEKFCASAQKSNINTITQQFNHPQNALAYTAIVEALTLHLFPIRN